jgi:hypothetical protein
MKELSTKDICDIINSMFEGQITATVTGSDGDIDKPICSELKTEIKEYKNFIKKLDEDVWNDYLELLSKYIKINEFNKLINKEQFTNEDVNKVEDCLDNAQNCILQAIQNKINKLINLYNTINF